MADEVGDGSGQPEKDVPEVRAGEPEKLVEQSVVPRKKGSKFWYVALIIIVLAAGYYSYSHVFNVSGSTAPSAPITGGAAAVVPETNTPAAEEKQAETPVKVPETIQSSSSADADNCSDGNVCTIDFFDTNTKSCTHAAISNCCGNNVCESDERCGTICADKECKSTVRATLCKQDCPLSCPASLVVHKLIDVFEDRLMRTPKTFTCESADCEQLDNAEFKFTGPASIKTFITNLGEQASDAVTSQFYCNYEYPKFDEPAAIKDGDTLNRMDQKLAVRDYFDGDANKAESDALNALQSVGQKTTTYSFAVEPVDAKYATALSCTVWLRSGDFTNRQDVKIKYVPA